MMVYVCGGVCGEREREREREREGGVIGMLTFVYIFYLLVKAIMNSSFKVFTNIYRGWGKSMMVGVRDKVG